MSTNDSKPIDECAVFLFSPQISLFSISKRTVDLVNAFDDIYCFNAR